MQCLLSTTIMWKISTHMMPTCCPALFYEGHSCDTETGLFKGSRDVHGVGGAGWAMIFKSHSTEIKLHALILNALQPFCNNVTNHSQS